MGSEAVWIPLVMAAVGTAASAYNTNQTAKRQDNQLAAQLRQQAAKQHEADAKTAQLIQAQAASSDADERAGSLAQYTKTLQQHQRQAVNPLQVQGAVSDAYKRAGSDAALGIANFGANQANMVSSIDAPTQQRQNDQFVMDRYKNDIDNISRFSRGDDFLADMKLRAIRRNPWIDAGASLANSYAGSSAGNVGGSLNSSMGDPYSGWTSSGSSYVGPHP